MASNSLSGHFGAGPGRLKKGAILSQISSTTTYIQVQKSLKSFIIGVSSGVFDFFDQKLPYHA
jgi:hypothetical protein